jgi:hypothetical protein
MDEGNYVGLWVDLNKALIAFHDFFFWRRMAWAKARPLRTDGKSFAELEYRQAMFCMGDLHESIYTESYMTRR